MMYPPGSKVMVDNVIYPIFLYIPVTIWHYLTLVHVGVLTMALSHHL